MGAVQLSEGRVKKLPLPQRGRKIWYDTIVPGFGLRVSSEGTRIFVLNYTIRARERRLTIGRWPIWSVTAAREEAKRLRRRIDLGDDPLEARDADRQAVTVADLLDAYETAELALKAKKTAHGYRQLLRDFVRPRLGKLKARDVQRTDVEVVHRAHRDTPYAANRALAILRAVFNWGIAHGLVENNPVRGVKKFPEHPRSRYLTPEELRRLLTALDADSNQEAADVIKFLVLTGARKAEVINMRWRDVDLEAAVWVKPHSSTKQRREHRVPLSGAALEVLRRRKPCADGPCVFPGRSHDGPRADVRWAWPRIRERAGLEGVRLHDIRHSFASFIASSGGSLLQIGALLGHSQTSTTARYSHLMDDFLREGAETVGAIVEAASAPPEAGPTIFRGK